VFRDIAEKALDELSHVLPPAWMNLLTSLQAAKAEVAQKK
jgi:hypothetical protein